LSLDDSSCWDGYCNRSGGSGSNDDDDDVWNGGRDSDVVNDDHNYEHAVDACLYLYTSVVVIMGVIPRQYTVHIGAIIIEDVLVRNIKPILHQGSILFFQEVNSGMRGVS
jgi:hypothetical protein